MQCQQCGTVLPEGSRFCSTCGTQLAPPPQAAPQPPYPVQEVAPTQPFPAPQPPAPAPAQQPPAAGQPAPYPATQQPQPQPQQPYAPQPPYPPEPPCEAQAAAPAPKKKRTGLIIGIILGVVLLLAVAGVLAVLLLLPSTTTTTVTPGAYAPVMPDVSAETTGSAIDVSDNTAAENAVTAFYAAINSGQLEAVSALVTNDTKSAIDPGAFEGWSTTTFEIARSVVDGDVAHVYGRESARAFGSADRGVKFTVVREGGLWLIETWQAVDEATVNGAMPSTGAGSGATTLSAASARDIVSSLLQARQVGDAETVRLLTTAKFQAANGAAWLDGVDNSPYFTAFTIKNVKASGDAYVVTVVEAWNSGNETATYTVIESDGAVLVDTWVSK